MAQPRESRLRRPTRTAQTAEYSHTHYLIIGLVLDRLAAKRATAAGGPGQVDLSSSSTGISPIR
jgi:hypothetical protein